MITKEMIAKGYEMGLVRLVESPNGNGSTLCEIGGELEFTFDFGGTGEDGKALKKFSPDMPTEDIVNELFKVFEWAREASVNYHDDAYEAYEEILKKNLDPSGYLREQTERFVRESQRLRMPVQSWEDLRQKYPVGREQMTLEEEEQFVEDCYKLYEKEGFSPRFWDLGLTDGLAERMGQQIEILGRCTVREDISLEDLPMWRGRFEDGYEINMYAEEIIPSAMMANGCRWFKDVLEYDSGMAARVAGLAVDVMLPQEMADVTGKAVRDGNKYYLPEDLDRYMSLEEQIAGAEKQKTDPAGKEVKRELDL